MPLPLQNAAFWCCAFQFQSSGPSAVRQLRGTAEETACRRGKCGRLRRRRLMIRRFFVSVWFQPPAMLVRTHRGVLTFLASGETSTCVFGTAAFGLIFRCDFWVLRVLFVVPQNGLCCHILKCSKFIVGWMSERVPERSYPAVGVLQRIPWLDSREKESVHTAVIGKSNHDLI